MLKWYLVLDGASNDYDSRVGVFLITPKGRQLCYALRFEFEAKNNGAEYGTLITGLNIAK